MDDRILRRFCAAENTRFSMTKPFYRGGFRYATDGRVAVRIAAATQKDDEFDPPCPTTETLKWEQFAGSALAPWPPAAYVFEKRWEECDCGEDYCTFEPSHAAQRVGNRLIGCQYHYLISTLPGVRFSVDGSEKDPIHFVFDGGEGLVMPVRADMAMDMPDRVCAAV